MSSTWGKIKASANHKNQSTPNEKISSTSHSSIKDSLQTNESKPSEKMSPEEIDSLLKALAEKSEFFDIVNKDSVKDRGGKLSQEEIDLIVKRLKNELGYDDVQEVRSEIQMLRDEIAKLRNENQSLKEEKVKEPPRSVKKYEAELAEAHNAVSQVFEKIFEDGEVEAISTCITKARIYDTEGESKGVGTGTYITTSISELCEEGLAAACEVFSNPRRIAIIKALVKARLSASEIGQKTGLVGGQLYHHLSSLENAGLIEKDGDKYKTDSSKAGTLVALYAVIGGMKIAKG
jgi:DNA-binding transcriptional ArsR family regulator